jgi:hypothetical protein
MKKQTHVPYGFISGLLMAVISLIIYVTGLTFKTGMSWLPHIPVLVGLILNANAYSKANEGYVTFGNVFGSCFKASMIVALVMIGYSVITIFVFPEMKEKMIEMQREQMAQNPKMTDEMMDTATDITQKYWNVMLMAGVIFGTLVAGAIYSLIAAAVAKKKGERPMTSGDSFTSAH